MAAWKLWRLPPSVGNTVIVPRDLCDCSIALSYLRDDVERAAEAVLDAHSDIAKPERALADVVALRDQLDCIIAEIASIVGVQVQPSDLDVLDRVGERR